MAVMPELESLLYEESDGVAWVTLNRPKALNAFDTTMQRELRELWLMLRKNDDVRCVVLTGSGEEAFCTGLDSEEFERFEDLAPGSNLPGYNSPWDFEDPGKSVCPKSNHLWKPVIAAVNGMACGGAFYILGEVDFIIAADHATFFDPHVTYGMAAAFEPIFLLHKAPFQEVMRLSLFGGPRAAFGRSGSPDRLRDRGRALRRAQGAGGLGSQRHRRAAGAGRARNTAGAVDRLGLSRRQALDHAFLFTNIGSDPALLAEGQKRRTSGERIDWRLR